MKKVFVAILFLMSASAYALEISSVNCASLKVGTPDYEECINGRLQIIRERPIYKYETDAESSYIDNVRKMESQFHRDRFTAVKGANEELLKGYNNQLEVTRFMDMVSEVALAEGDQRNTIFTKDGIVTAFTTYKGHARIKYLQLLKRYRDLLQSDKNVVAGLPTLKTAIENRLKYEGYPDREAEKIAASVIDNDCFRLHPVHAAH